MQSNRPQPGDFIPYQSLYIDKVGDGDIVDILTGQHEELGAFLKAIPKEKALYAYADSKWTVKEVIGHMTDTERIMAYRLLRFARNDKSPLPGFEQDDYVINARFNDMDMEILIDEFLDVRKANLYLFKSLSADEIKREGTASGNRITVNALLYVIAGHAYHHVKLCKELYL